MMGKASRKIFKFLVVFLIIAGMTFSNASFHLASTLVNSYISTRGIVDKIWLVQKENDSDIVDRYASLRSLPEKLKIHEAKAAFTARTETTANSSGGLSSPYNLSCNTPGGVTNGDIMFMWVGLRNTAGSVIDSVDASWNLIASKTSTSDKYYLYWKIASNEPASYTVSVSGSGTGQRFRIVMTAYSAGDWDSADPIDIVSNTNYTTSNSIARAATMNVSAANSPLIFFGALYNTSTSSWTKPANIGSDAWVEDYDNRNATSDFSVEIASMIITSSGATGNMDGTNTLTSQAAKHAFAVALNPPPPADPTISISQPDGTSDTVAENSSYNITYTLADSDSVATAAFYYDTNTDMSGGTAISGACATAAEGTNATCSWNTAGVSPGAYYVYGVTSASPTAVSALSPGIITINDAPTLTVTQPDGTGDTVTVGDSYDITYTLADTDSVVTVDFYYDTDGSGLNGTSITGCQNEVEGAGVVCSWDTTGMTPGDYYVYGSGADDGVNAEVSDYSPGVITIQAAGSLSVDIVNSGGTPVGSPSVSFSAETFNWVGQTSTGTLGVSSQKIRLTNTTGDGTWNLTVGATGGASTLWQGATYNYDFNGSAANGRLQVDPSVGTITPEGGCGAASPSKGTAAYFDAGNSITLLTSTTSFGCYWDLTGVALTQDIPAQQQADSYSIGMTLTAS